MVAEETERPSEKQRTSPELPPRPTEKAKKASGSLVFDLPGHTPAACRCMPVATHIRMRVRNRQKKETESRRPRGSKTTTAG